nr:immunoglobulin light chain junction region [Macaca mulatta]
EYYCSSYASGSTYIF